MDARKEIEAIFERALEEARKIECSMADYADALDQVIDDLQIESDLSRGSEEEEEEEEER
jgi:hypothetical protein